jgi:uncharacterized repeat protein (TIGR01451 family)
MRSFPLTKGPSFLRGILGSDPDRSLGQVASMRSASAASSFASQAVRHSVAASHHFSTGRLDGGSKVTARHGIVAMESSPKASVSARRETLFRSGRALKGLEPGGRSPESGEKPHGFQRLGTTWFLAIAILSSCILGVLILGTENAHADTGGPQWTVTAVSRPTNFKPGGDKDGDAYRVLVTNTGSAPSDGSPVAITDELPSGLSLDSVGASGEDELICSKNGERRHCSQSARPLT